MRVLIVEDNAATREMLRIVVTRLGHEVAGEVSDGRKAAEAFRELRPEVVLLDIIMPGKSGVEVMDEIYEQDPAVKVVVVTAVHQDEVRRHVASMAAAVVFKPFSYEEMQAVFSKLK